MISKKLEQTYQFFLDKKLDYLLLFLIILVYFSYLQRGAFIGDPDGFYHAKMAWFLSQGQLIKELPWMQFSTLKEGFANHHLLYHLCLLPFIYLTGPLSGVKIATIFFSSLMATTFYWLLKKMQLSWPALFALLLITMSGLTFRLSLVKANSLSLIIIFFLIFALYQRRKKMVFSLSFLFVWLYGGWPLAIIILIAFLLADILYKKINKNKIKIFFQKIINSILIREKKSYPRLKISLSMLSGLLAGIIINPYWPKNLYFYYQQIIQTNLTNLNRFPVGAEWSGTSLNQIFLNAPHIFILAGIAFIILVYNSKKISHFSFFSFFLCLFFLFLTIKSKRYIEYSMPFLLLFTASATNDLKKIGGKKIKKWWNQNNLFLKSIILIPFLILSSLFMSIIYAKTLNPPMSRSWSLDRFTAGSRWLAENSQKGEIVFHSSWDQWPLLFYFNHHNYYIIGLDPTFMENFDSELHTLYREITLGQIENNLSQLIKENFGASYILAEKKRHKTFIENLSNENQLKMVYHDDDIIIYHLP